MNLLEVKGLCKNYKGFSLQDISFELPAGYIAGYVGKNGAGKTTTLNLITGLAHADGGEIRLEGRTYEEDPAGYKESIGYIGDGSYFPKEMKIRDIRTILKLHYASFKQEKFDSLIKGWQLPENKRIGEFSRGMKVKLMFASVLGRDTRLLILDEATNGLDPVMREEILGILQAYIEDGERSVLFSTHVLSDLEQIADFIFFIDNGRLYVKESKDELLERYLLIRGERKELKDGMEKLLIGAADREFGFEAMIEADMASAFGSHFVYDRPNIDSIILHLVKERQEKQGGR